MTGTIATTTLITLNDPRSPVTEAYRALRTNIQFASLDRPVQTILITSADPGEGKSTILANLGVVMAQAGRKTLLVDADLRRPQLHAIFGKGNEQGLTSLMMTTGTKDLPLQETGVPNLTLLTSGPLPPNPAEVLASRRLDDVLQQLKGEAEIVLFDAPPVVAVTDAVILASKVDGVLLVVNAGKTRREMARRAKVLLDKANARLLGAILNNVKTEKSVYSY